MMRFSLPLFLAAITAVPPFSRPAMADVTLVYGEVAKDEEGKDHVVSAQRIYLRDDAMALETFGESRVVIFDRNSGAVHLVDHDREIYFDLDEAMVAEVAERLSDTQRKVLDGLEKKVAEMPKDERKKLRRVMDDLYAATEAQLSKPPKTRLETSDQPRKSGDFEATTVVDVFRNDNLDARFFMVDHEQLKMSAGEFETLVEFQDLVKRLAEQTPGMLRRQFGDFSMIANEGRIPVEAIIYDPAEGASVRRLLNHFDREIEEEWFTIPEEYQAVTFRPHRVRPGDPAPPTAKP